jgi:hypothetical protein
MKISPDIATSAASFGGAALSVAAGLTLQDYGILLGMATALITCANHIYYSSKRAALEEAVAKARIAEAMSHTGAANVPK